MSGEKNRDMMSVVNCILSSLHTLFCSLRDDILISFAEIYFHLCFLRRHKKNLCFVNDERILWDFVYSTGVEKEIVRKEFSSVIIHKNLTFFSFRPAEKNLWSKYKKSLLTFFWQFRYNCPFQPFFVHFVSTKM